MTTTTTTHPLATAYQRMPGFRFTAPLITWEKYNDQGHVRTAFLVTVRPDDARQSYRDVLVGIKAGLTPEGDYAADVRMPIGTNPRPQQAIVRGETLAAVQQAALILVAQQVETSRQAWAGRS